MSTIDSLAKLTVTAKSPDGSVRIRLAASEPASVELHGPVAGLHTEDSLAEQVRLALTAAISGFRRAQRTRLGIGEERDEPGPRADDRRRFNGLVAKIAFSVVSGGANVKVGWSGVSRVAVGIRPGALDRLGAGELAGELTECATAAIDRFGEELRRAHFAVYVPKYWGER